MYSRFFLAVSCVNKVSDREQVIDTSTVAVGPRVKRRTKDLLTDLILQEPSARRDEGSLHGAIDVKSQALKGLGHARAPVPKPWLHASDSSVVVPLGSLSSRERGR